MSAAFEEALKLKAEAHAAGEAVLYQWFLPHDNVDVRKMQVGTRQPGSTAMAEGQCVVLTFLPYMATRTITNEESSAAPALVKVYQPESDGNEVPNSEDTDC